MRGWLMCVLTGLLSSFLIVDLPHKALTPSTATAKRKSDPGWPLCSLSSFITAPTTSLLLFTRLIPCGKGSTIKSLTALSDGGKLRRSLIKPSDFQKGALWILISFNYNCNYKFENLKQIQMKQIRGLGITMRWVDQTSADPCSSLLYASRSMLH